MEATFADRTAIVTGGASGIGRAIGARLSAGGAHVVLADVDGPAARRTAAELDERPGATGSVVGTGLDVRRADDVGALVEEVVSRHGRVDLMFNNAGIVFGGRTHQMPPPYWERIIDVNIRGVVNGVLAAYPVMVGQGAGQIVNTASGAGLAPS